MASTAESTRDTINCNPITGIEAHKGKNVEAPAGDIDHGKSALRDLVDSENGFVIVQPE